MGSAEKVNLEEKLAVFDEHWCPRIVGELNGQHVKLVRILGGFSSVTATTRKSSSSS